MTAAVELAGITKRFGDVTAVEADDASGDTIVQIFGKRKPGLTELTEWREIVSSLPRQGVAA